ncbi:hypothetical protein Vadar_024860 [Vaccinium darrowii]|uniref:Uncharacterized protein n=1 Tax=Vaccinium darrowii TaxID=229202 RepID=A0ACB7XK61_9ERIC|nr:hypothetical protein Vadar_024860 [Vaccinium darrowii]
MSPAKVHSQQEQEKRAIIGPRPNPLRIKEDSHVTKKHSFFPREKTRNSDHHPVIIYANSPKIIHAKARDFMALVQSLTGLSRPNEVIENEKRNPEVEDSNGSSSTISMEEISAASHQYLADMPLFTPSSTNLLFSPLPMYRYADAVSFSPLPNLGCSVSPSVFSVKREFPKFSEDGRDSVFQ